MFCFIYTQFKSPKKEIVKDKKTEIQRGIAICSLSYVYNMSMSDILNSGISYSKFHDSERIIGLLS